MRLTIGNQWLAHTFFCIVTVALVVALIVVLFTTDVGAGPLEQDLPTDAERREMNFIWVISLAIASGLLLAGFAWSWISDLRVLRLWGVFWFLILMAIITLSFFLLATLPFTSIVGGVLLWVSAWVLAAVKSTRHDYVVITGAVLTWIIYVGIMVVGDFAQVDSFELGQGVATSIDSDAA